jgi:hypothetical protein
MSFEGFHIQKVSVPVLPTQKQFLLFFKRLISKHPTQFENKKLALISNNKQVSVSQKDNVTYLNFCYLTESKAREIRRILTKK